MSKTRRLAADRRRDLLFPVLMLVILTLVAVGILLYWSADALNRRQAVAQESLVSSTLETNLDALRSLVIDYAWWDEAVTTFDVGLDERWAKEELGDYLLEAFGVNCIWVLGPGNETKIAFINGKPSTIGLFERMPPSVSLLLDAARQGRSIDQVPAAGFVAIDGQLEIVAASIVSPFETIAGPPDPDSASVIVFGRPLGEAFFAAQSLNSFLGTPEFSTAAPPDGFLGHVIAGFDGVALGNIVWRDLRSGDDVIWRAAPLLLAALLILCLLLVLTVRRVEAVVLREGRLTVSLDHERQRRQDKSRFVSMVSHELRTPLQAIGSAADMLDRYGDQMSLAERQEETQTIRRGVAALARLVDDVLLVGRVDAPRPAGDGEVVDLAELCSAVWREVSLALKATQTLRLNDRIGHPVVGASQVMLNAVLSNLLQNAAKYAAEASEIEVELAEEPDCYRLAVRDFGPGIPADLHEAVFEPYWRAESTAALEGAGLGLPVARAAARSLGGNITIESDDLDRGTRFVLRWPR
ncbi:hypothetical protein HBA54_15955 [Pelagibius litoralis]|uniref:histidine kinase n=1 Tax=Pelagibius litoralis TaxID=374515 RepID=A0A967EZ92_9PROT|nr:ATP-binding protein [Pelagibius litoralis]NIA70100.1 hypothetical protein [Pelagibius litoralis]